MMDSNTKMTYRILIFIITLTITQSCNMVYDNLTSCPQSLTLQFKSVSPCGTPNDFSNVSNLYIDLYSPTDSNKLASFNQVPIHWNSSRTLSIPFNKVGNYYLRIWGNNSSNIWSFQKDSYGYFKNDTLIADRKNELYFALEEFKIEDKKKLGTVNDTLTVNLIPYTYTINLTLLGLPDNNNCKMIWEDRNAAYNSLGTTLNYPIIYAHKLKQINNKAHISFNVFKLDKSSNSILKVVNARGDVLAKMSFKRLISLLDSNGGYIDFNCIHTLNLELYIETFNKYIVRINGWNLVYHSVTLD